MSHILLGVTGSIAAFKACHLASDWTKAGHEVRVIETTAAEQFVTPLTFTSLTHTQTRTAMFPHVTASAIQGDVVSNPANPASINHIADAAWADALVVAPASADIIARIAAGLADDTLTSTILAYSGTVKVLCPAMNVHMFENPATQRNLDTCRALGWTIVEPGSGNLACGDTGKGRMEEPAAIEQAVARLLDEALPQSTAPADTAANASAATAADAAATASATPAATPLPLQGLHVLITAGPTQEPLDPVRFLTNHSTGKMGYGFAHEAAALGATVTLVSGPVNLPEPSEPGIETVHVTTAQQMFEAVQQSYEAADIVVMTAAVADFRVSEVAGEKIKKAGRTSIQIELVSNPDILAWVGAHKRTDGSQVLCGFAMETQNLIENAAKKLASKNCDMLVANNLREAGAGFGTDTNVVTVLTPGASGGDSAGTPNTDAPNIEKWQKMDKTDLARRLLLRLAGIRKA
ncbi:bifunctional phosphopantothenoylcysteine decarboxylase/phosphopantothenate synthase [Bifidobacterium sp. 64T4]|uniref:bifunctional phosphopantothenoylcysteine decarboxylase/phosphopantothenate synthase n=1 Tax=Bifidobacterium pongonis TaxID=2834432 RepID=UPI001C590D61|nr:bifunctional phosphopantothenoylcysteine decarboxylase/phosphopantothenate synthase [Bifidobacterium pongonis]MBW3094303.1 bifunctional phosphopantothenoylcysteine decarboxylase/phosphopantothenate synthase [Bifidobacterium pongonis]